MSIKNNRTTKGTAIDKLSRHSMQRVIKICDRCKTESETSFNDLQTCREKRKTNKDYCHKCACFLYNRGVNNAAKRPCVRLKISQKLAGKSKKFKDG